MTVLTIEKMRAARKFLDEMNETPVVLSLEQAAAFFPDGRLPPFVVISEPMPLIPKPPIRNHPTRIVLGSSRIKATKTR